MEVIYLWFALSAGFALGWVACARFTKARARALHIATTIDLRPGAGKHVGGARPSGAAARDVGRARPPQREAVDVN